MILVAIPLYPDGGSTLYANPEQVTHVIAAGESAVVHLSNGKHLLTQESAAIVRRRLMLLPVEDSS